MQQALILASVVLGAAIAFELEHLNQVLRSEKVKWHWAQPIFAVLVLILIVSFWWAIAKDADGPITIAQFMPALIQMIILALLAAASIPDRVPEEGLDLAHYYQRSRKYQWFLFALFIWIANIRWFPGAWKADGSIAQFVLTITPDAAVGVLIIAMMYVRQWWLVALGLGGLSMIFSVLLTRSMG